MEQEPKKETYYSKNRQRLCANQREYTKQNKEYYKAYWKAYYQANKAALLEKRKEYARTHRDAIYEKNRTVYYPRHQAKTAPAASPADPGVQPVPWSIQIHPGGTVTFD